MFIQPKSLHIKSLKVQIAELINRPKSSGENDHCDTEFNKLYINMVKDSHFMTAAVYEEDLLDPYVRSNHLLFVTP